MRRIITGHTPDGRAIVIADEHVTGRALAEMPGRTDATFFQLWATHEMPADNSADEALARGREGSTSTTLGNHFGSVLRIGELAAGTRSPMHRTQSLVYGICLEGECDLELDGGDSVTVKAGDVVIQRGTNHRWHNRSDAPCRFAWILLDAAPILVDGEPLEVNWSD